VSAVGHQWLVFGNVLPGLTTTLFVVTDGAMLWHSGVFAMLFFHFPRFRCRFPTPWSRSDCTGLVIGG